MLFFPGLCLEVVLKYENIFKVPSKIVKFVEIDCKVMEIWDKIKQTFTGERRKFAWFVTVVLVCFVFSWMFGSGNTIFHWIHAKKEIKRQEAQIEEYKSRIEQMEGSIDQRVTDLDTLEKFAREQYHFAAPGEDVYVIEE